MNEEFLILNKNYIETEMIKNLINRSLLYLNSGFGIRFNGASGTGKTSMALKVAEKLGRPIIFICGDESFSSKDLLGNELGFKSKKTFDNFIASVYKTEEEIRRLWIDNRITTACKYGYTLVYDEYTRTPPESNNLLLSVLEEGVLQLPPERGAENYIKVDSDFRAIFTSNPAEYAGVHASQDALLDRLITISLKRFDSETEKVILRKQTDIKQKTASTIISFINDLRSINELKDPPSLRGGIKLAKIMKQGNLSIPDDVDEIKEICIDIFSYNDSTVKIVEETVQQYFGGEFDNE